MKIKKIFDIDDPVRFITELEDYLSEKRNSNTGFTKGERLIDLYLGFMADKDMNGFCDLFYQEFSLEECNDVINWFSELGLYKASENFSEALDIYCRRKKVTSQEYSELNPFDLKETERKRFEEIDDFFNSEECGLYGCEDLIKEWIVKNENLFK